MHSSILRCSFGPRSLYTLRDMLGESMDVLVCERHAADMPLADGDRITELRCEFAARSEVAP
jgi:hypothetical protein